MKPLIFLLAAVAALPLAKPEAEVWPGPRTGANSATEATAATALVVFGSDTVRAEVANTSALRSQGLMYREEVPDGTGMLFVWDSEAERSFWMQNTYVALDIAFIDRDFRIVDIQQMEPRATEVHEGASHRMQLQAYQSRSQSTGTPWAIPL